MELYLQKRADLLAFFTARTGSVSAAEDVVQEIYLKIHSLDDAQVVNGFAFLIRLGLNLTIDRYRSEARGRMRDATYTSTIVTTIAGIGVSDAPSSEDILDSRARLQTLLRAAEALPEQCRRVFRMHKLEGMSHLEVAQALGISRSAVEKHIMTALRQLAAAMK